MLLGTIRGIIGQVDVLEGEVAVWNREDPCPIGDHAYKMQMELLRRAQRALIEAVDVTEIPSENREEFLGHVKRWWASGIRFNNPGIRCEPQNVIVHLSSGGGMTPHNYKFSLVAA